MQIRNVRPWALEIAATGQVVEGGATTEVADDLGSALCEQPANWAVVSEEPKAPKKPAVTGEEA